GQHCPGPDPGLPGAGGRLGDPLYRLRADGTAAARRGVPARGGTAGPAPAGRARPRPPGGVAAPRGVPAPGPARNAPVRDVTPAKRRHLPSTGTVAIPVPTSEPPPPAPAKGPVPDRPTNHSPRAAAPRGKPCR